MEARRRNDFREEEQLRRLLFGREIDLLELLRAETHRLDRRVGDDPTLTQSVRRVIVDVLRDANVTDHEQVATALAPLVVETVRSEIRRSRETLVETLRPAAGRMLWAGVAGSIRGAAAGIESIASPARWLARRRRARAGGESRLIRVVIVHRATGGLLVGVPQADLAAEDGVSGMLAAVGAFVRERLPPEREGQIRRIRFGDTDLHIRATPTLVFASQGRGQPPVGFHEELEYRFLDFLDRWGEVLTRSEGRLPDAEARLIADDIAARFLPNDAGASAGVGAVELERPPRFGYAALGLIALLLVAGTGHAAWHSWRAGEVEGHVRAWLRGDPGLTALPIGVAFDSRQNLLTAEGVVPSAETRERLAQGLRRIVPDGSQVELRVAMLGGGGSIAEAGPIAEEIARLSRRIDALPEPDHLGTIEGWLARHPIRFADGASYRDESLAQQILGAIAELFAAWPLEFGIRVVGYSDADGSASANIAASRTRAERVVADLVALGVPAERVMAVGRGAERLVDADTGSESGNRRVEFELYLPR